MNQSTFKRYLAFCRQAKLETTYVGALKFAEIERRYHVTN